jgi:uncharacterized protein (TIGR02266 family)
LAKYILAIWLNLATCQNKSQENKTHKLLYLRIFLIYYILGTTFAPWESYFQNPIGGGQMDTPQYRKAEVKWLVVIETDERSIDGVTWEVSPNGIFISCAEPLRLNEVCNLTLRVPSADRSLEAKAEVVWSNIYGQNDEITPRGMGLRFLEISSEHRQLIAKEVFQQLKSDNVDPREMEALQTIMIEQDETGSEAA